MNLYDDLYKSAASFLYVFVSPKANINKAIMAKRVAQLNRLSEMYAKDKTYTPAQMIEIIRKGIADKYKKSPELVLQIIYDNASRILNKGIGASYEGLTYDGESNQYYDGSGNAYQLDNSSNIIQKNGEAVTPGSSNVIENPSNIEEISLSQSGGSFWGDVASVIEWIVDLLSRLGIVKTKETIRADAPVGTDWSSINSTSTADFSTYLPWVIGAGIVITALTGTKDKKKTKS